MWFILGLVGELRKKLFRLLLQAFYLRFFFNRFISRIDNRFKSPRSDQGFPFKRFFQKTLHLHLFLSPHSDLFIQQLFFLFKLWLWTRDFFAYARSFPNPISLEELLNLYRGHKIAIYRSESPIYFTATRFLLTELYISSCFVSLRQFSRATQSVLGCSGKCH